MSEQQITKVEKQDITAPIIEPGGTAIVLQRHERYNRDRAAENAGSIDMDVLDEAHDRDVRFFEDVLNQESDGIETSILFVSSDTQYAGKGYRSLETAQIAQNAAVEALQARGINSAERIVNFNNSFKTDAHEPTGHKIRPISKLREPKMFDTPAYVDHLRQIYGKEEGPGTGISQRAWAAHEADEEKEVREAMGAEGVYDIVDRTKQSLAILKRYSEMFHANNPNKRLVIWAASHYDTISPLVKDAANISFDEYVPVDYGAGVVITVEPRAETAELTAQNQRVALPLGKDAVTHS